MLEIVAFFALALWLYLLAGRGGFWLAPERDAGPEPEAPAAWPKIVAVIPARDEAPSIAQTVRSLLHQDYPELHVIVVDDGSQDGTATVAAQAAVAAKASDRVTVLPGRPLPPGWTGKLWAVKQGVEAAAGIQPRIFAAHRCRYRLRAGRAQTAVARAPKCNKRC